MKYESGYCCRARCSVSGPYGATIRPSMDAAHRVCDISLGATGILYLVLARRRASADDDDVAAAPAECNGKHRGLAVCARCRLQ